MHHQRRCPFFSTLALLVATTGCHVWVPAPEGVTPRQAVAGTSEGLDRPGGMRISRSSGTWIQIVLRDASRVQVRQPWVSRDSIGGHAAGGAVAFALADVAQVRLREVSELWTGLAILSALGAVFVIAVAL